MGLKIEYLSPSGAKGVLDGALPFELVRTETSLKAKIAGWIHEIEPGGFDPVAEIRHAVYAALAHYRNEHRPAP